ncbi:MAG: hypothetical protein ACK4GQ_05635 [Candidatus Hadarchaeales archaeon]
MKTKKILVKKPKLTKSEIEDIRTLCDPLKNLDGGETAGQVAELSDAMLEISLSTIKEADRRKAIEKMWEMEEWLTGKL